MATETFYRKPLNASLNAPILTAVVDETGKCIREFVWQPNGNYRDSGAPWGCIGLSITELKREGFTKEPAQDLSEHPGYES